MNLGAVAVDDNLIDQGRNGNRDPFLTRTLESSSSTAPWIGLRPIPIEKPAAQVGFVLQNDGHTGGVPLACPAHGRRHGLGGEVNRDLTVGPVLFDIESEDL